MRLEAAEALQAPLHRARCTPEVAEARQEACRRFFIERKMATDIRTLEKSAKSTCTDSKKERAHKARESEA